MNPEKKAQIENRSRNRRLRALRREARRLRQSKSQIPEQLVKESLALSQRNPNDKKDQPSTRTIPKSPSGCGGCKKRAERLKKQIENAKSMPDFSGKEPFLPLNGKK